MILTIINNSKFSLKKENNVVIEKKRLKWCYKKNYQ